MRGSGNTRPGVSGAGRLVLLLATMLGAGGGAALATDAPGASVAPASVSASPAASPGPRRIHLSTTSFMGIVDEAGRPVTVLAVQPGETLEISVGNQARFAHNLFIGPYEALAADKTADLPGVPAFTGGSQAFTWTVPESVEELWFGCTVVGHFAVMKGRVVAIAEVMPDLVGLAETDAVAMLEASGLLAAERLEMADPAVPAGTILAQEPPAGAAVDLGTVVRYTVSSGPARSG